MISFARGVLRRSASTPELLADCARAAIERDGRDPHLRARRRLWAAREWIAERHGVEPARVVLTNGALQGFVFFARSCSRALQGGARRGADLRPAAEDPRAPRRGGRAARRGREGSTRRARRGARRRADELFLYTIPTFQNPSGRTLSTSAARRVVELAAEHGLPVLEDDPYGLVRFEGEAPPSLFELEGGEPSPTLVVLEDGRAGRPRRLVRRAGRLAREVEARAVSTYISPPLPHPGDGARADRRGPFEPNLERVSGLLRARRDAMLGALERQLAGGATWSEPEGGYFLWLDLPADAASCARAEAAGVTFVKGADFFPAARWRASARLAFSYASRRRSPRASRSSPRSCA